MKFINLFYIMLITTVSWETKKLAEHGLTKKAAILQTFSHAYFPNGIWTKGPIDRKS